MRHVFVKVSPGLNAVASGTLTSATKAAESVQSGELVGAGESGVCVTGTGVVVCVTSCCTTAVDVGATGVDVGAGDGVGDALLPQAASRKDIDKIPLMIFFIILTRFDLHT